MERTCLACHKPLTGQQVKWCTRICRWRGHNNIRNGKPFDAHLLTQQVSCAWCGESLAGRCLTAKYCSNRCKLDAGHQQQRKRMHSAKRSKGLPIPGDIVPCANPQCFNGAVYANLRAFCSNRCKVYVASNKHWLGDGPSTRVYFYPCPDCSIPILARVRNGSHKVCAACRVVRNKAINARKNHARRVAGEPVLSANEIAKRDGCRCHICHRKVDMNLSGKAKWGPTIEHIIPVSRGGTNDPGNLALAHRYCNTARGNRGHSQLLLVA
jgi:hypothetical protein